MERLNEVLQIDTWATQALERSYTGSDNMHQLRFNGYSAIDCLDAAKTHTPVRPSSSDKFPATVR